MTSLQNSSSETTSSCKPGHPSIGSHDKDVAFQAQNLGPTPSSPDADKKRDDEVKQATKPNQKVTSQASRPLHPFVFWSHTDSHLSIRVDLSQAKDVKVEICGEASSEDCGSDLLFTAKGRGAQGLRDYHFELNLFSEVKKKHSCYIIERHVLILISKADLGIQWKRLTKQSVKLPWLRVDFDRYADSGGDSDVDSEADGLARDRQAYEQLKESLRRNTDQQVNSNQYRNSWSNRFSNIFNKMKYDYRKETVNVDNSKNTARHALDYKKTYLFIYNLAMFVMFLKVYIVLLIKGLSGTVDDDIVEGTAFIVKILTLTQLLETLHPILGLVPGGPMMPFLQVSGRLLVNTFLTHPEIRLDSAPYAHYLFMVWSSIEIFRYSFYALRVFKVDIYFLTWCRYTLFIPLYPMGGFCESMVVLSTIKYIEKTGAYTVDLPNRLNMSFSPVLVLKTHVYLLLGPSIYYLMRYMWKQRCKQLSKEKAA